MHTWYTHTHIWHLMAWAYLSGVFVKALNCCSTPNTTKCLDSEFNSVWVKVIDRNKLWIMWWCTHVNVRSNQWLRRFFFFLLILLLFLFSAPLPLILYWIYLCGLFALHSIFFSMKKKKKHHRSKYLWLWMLINKQKINMFVMKIQCWCRIQFWYI